MTREELIQALAQSHPHLKRRDAGLAIITLFSSIRDALARGEKVEIRGFGSFKIRSRKAREGRNPKTGEQVFVPSRRALLFHPSRQMGELLNRRGGSKGSE